VALVTPLAEHAPDGSAWRYTAIMIWVGAPAVTLVYLFRARDARRELKAVRHAP
jgi:hypothetical protein